MAFLEEDWETGKYQHNPDFTIDVVTRTVEVSYTIYRYTYADGSPTQYDWYASGDDSDEWYQTPEEAEAAAISHLGG